MKTIEEGAKEHSENQPFGVWKYNAIESFKAGVEFAQRWIHVHEELPERYENVLVRNEEKIYIASLQAGDVFVSNVSVNYIQTIILNITHWRPIELI